MTISIDRCPLCEKKHSFPLQVQHSTASFARKPLPHTYTRLFTCPTTGQTFQAPVTIEGGYRIAEAEQVVADMEQP